MGNPTLALEVRRHTLPPGAVAAIEAAGKVYNEQFALEFWTQPSPTLEPLLENESYRRRLASAFLAADKTIPSDLVHDMQALKDHDHVVVVGNIPKEADFYTLLSKERFDLMTSSGHSPLNFVANYLMTKAQVEPTSVTLRSELFFTPLVGHTHGQALHQDFILSSEAKSRALAVLHCLNQGNPFAATRFLNVATTALHNPEIAGILMDSTGVDIKNAKPEGCQDWSYFLDHQYRKNFYSFLLELTQKKIGTTRILSDDHGTLLLLESGEMALFNDARLLHSRASHGITIDCLQPDTRGTGPRAYNHYQGTFEGNDHPLAVIRAQAKSSQRQEK